MKNRILVYLEPNDLRQLSVLAASEERQMPAQAAYIIKQHLRVIACPMSAEAQIVGDVAQHPQGAKVP